MQTSPHIKSYASMGTLQASVCRLFCWLCLVQNAVAGPPPVITTQPRNQTVQSGGTATFEVAATSGTTLTYQWYYQSNSIPGATNSIYSITNAQQTHAGVYYAKVSNADGTVNSANATLTVNSSPSLSGANDLTAISQNEVNNSGTLVSDLIAGKQTDPDPGALQGIAVVAVNNANGTWEYSTDGGSDWSPFGSPTENTARLLAADANSRVRFVPNANFVGTVANGLTFRAWDQSVGSNGGNLAITISSNTVLDQFTAVSYFNNDGTQLWNTRWVETEVGAIGPASGYFKVNGGLDQLRLTANHIGDNIYREANLIGATSATLSYWYDSTQFGQSVALQIQVSADAGVSFTPLKTYVSPGTSGTQSFDITSYISPNTQVRFYVSTGQTSNNDFKIDNVQIAYSSPGGGFTAFSTDTASSSFTVLPAADIATTLAGPITVSAAAVFSYIASVTNAGPSTANEVLVNSTLPAGVIFVSASDGGTYNAGVVTWSLASLNSGAAAHFTVTVIAPTEGNLTSSVLSTALTSDPNAANNDGSSADARIVTTVIPQADVAATLTGPTTVSAAAEFAYTISVTNAGPSTANDVLVSSTLPASVIFVSASDGGTHNAGVITWSLASLNSGAAAHFTVTVTAPTEGSLTNSVASTSATTDLVPDNNDGSAPTAQVTTTVTPVADIATTVTGPAIAITNVNFTYTVMVANLGPSGATTLSVSDTLPAGAMFVSASNGGTHNAGVVTWELASLNSGTAAHFTVTAVAAAIGSLTNIAASSAVGGDPDMSNNNGSATAARVVTEVHPFLALTGQWLPSGGFQVEFYTYPDTTLSILASSNLTDWETLITTNSGSGHVVFIDQDAVGYPQRFYRSLQAN